MKLLADACQCGLRAVVWMVQCLDEPQKAKDIAVAVTMIDDSFEQLTIREVIANRSASDSLCEILAAIVRMRVTPTHSNVAKVQRQ